MNIATEPVAAPIHFDDKMVRQLSNRTPFLLFVSRFVGGLATWQLLLALLISDGAALRRAKRATL